MTEAFRAEMGGPYRTIVADPPWPISDPRSRPLIYRSGGRRRASTQLPYRLMAIPDIQALTVSRLAAKDATLFLWCTRKVFREGQGCAVARSWGFEPCGEVIWGLPNPGFGQVIGNDHEPVLIARRGRNQLRGIRHVGVHFWRQLYNGSRGKIHSAKPPEFMDLVEEISPGPYLELFARRERDGWDSWGDEVSSSVMLS